MSVKENLKKAMKIVKNHWVKGEFATGRGRYCAVGAIRHVTGCAGGPEVAALERHLPKGVHTVPYFNDNVATHKDIMNLFSKAIRDC